MVPHLTNVPHDRRPPGVDQTVATYRPLTYQDKLARFERDLRAMLEDLRRLLEVTARRKGSRNHGSNFAAVALVFSAVDFVSDFARYPTAEEVDAHRERQRQLRCLVKKAALPSEERKEILGLIDAKKDQISGFDSTATSVRFIERYFPEEYRPVAAPLWRLFRNPLVHAFAPGRTADGLRTQVDWYYADEVGRVGAKVDDIRDKLVRDRDRFRHRAAHLVIDSASDDPNTGSPERISLNAQVLFIDLQDAIGRFLMELTAAPEESELAATFDRAFDDWRTRIDVRDEREMAALRSLPRRNPAGTGIAASVTQKTAKARSFPDLSAFRASIAIVGEPISETVMALRRDARY